MAVGLNYLILTSKIKGRSYGYQFGLYLIHSDLSSIDAYPQRFSFAGLSDYPQPLIHPTLSSFISDYFNQKFEIMGLIQTELRCLDFHQISPMWVDQIFRTEVETSTRFLLGDLITQIIYKIGTKDAHQGLVYSAYFGVMDLVRIYIPMGAASYPAALWAAARGGSLDIFELLDQPPYNTRAKIKHKNQSTYYRCFESAVANNHIPIMLRIIHHIDQNTLQSGLQTATKRGYTDMMAELQSKIDMNINLEQQIQNFSPRR